MVLGESYIAGITEINLNLLGSNGVSHCYFEGHIMDPPYTNLVISCLAQRILIEMSKQTWSKVTCLIGNQKACKHFGED